MAWPIDCVAAGALLDFVASLLRNYCDWPHPSCCADHVAGSALGSEAIASNYFVVVAATIDDLIASVVDIESDLRHSNFLVDVGKIGLPVVAD